MEDFFIILLLGIIVFIATNIDDFFISIVFLSDPNYDVKHIVIGKYIGISLLILISTISSFAALIIPVERIGFLGLLPIIIGIKNLIKSISKNEDLSEGPAKEITVSKKRFLNPNSSRILSMSVITFANGGDNIGTYIPLFAISDFFSDNSFYYYFFNNDSPIVHNSILPCK